ncbi:MAG: rhodanese-like domain-containing protein [Pseudomonadota bacterium]
MTADATIATMTPVTAFAALEGDQNAVLVDVRTRAEWGFVGVPDLSSIGREALFVEWQSFPSMAVNTSFCEAVVDAAGGTLPEQILFICRSGARSHAAAEAVSAFARSQGLTAVCVNVVEGFEGDLDVERHRGKKNGWKAHGLPWRQT